MNSIARYLGNIHIVFAPNVTIRHRKHENENERSQTLVNNPELSVSPGASLVFGNGIESASYKEKNYMTKLALRQNVHACGSISFLLAPY